MRLASPGRAFLGEMLGLVPDVQLLVLVEADWAGRAAHPIYGMPNSDRGTLCVAAEPDDFWMAFVEMLDETAPSQSRDAYPGENDGIDLAPFFDLLAIHELAHAFQTEGEVRFPRLRAGLAAERMFAFGNAFAHNHLALSLWPARTQSVEEITRQDLRMRTAEAAALTGVLAHGARALLDLGRGRLDSAAEHLEIVLLMCEDFTATAYGWTDLYSSIALLSIARGQPSEAIDSVRESLARSAAEIAAIAVRLGLVPETMDGDDPAGPMASAWTLRSAR